MKTVEKLINTESIQIKSNEKLLQKHLGVVDLYTINILQNELNYTKNRKKLLHMFNVQMI